MTWRWECIEAAGPRRGEEEPEEAPALPEDEPGEGEPEPAEPAESEDE